ncbi:unnamed protein product [Chrysoparadoxa australica]
MISKKSIKAIVLPAVAASSLLSLPLYAADTVTIQSMKRVEIDRVKPELKTFYIENFYYEDFIYSKGKKTELGDQAEINAAVRYQFSDNTYFRGRFATFPEENRFNNKTGRFELLADHTYNSVDFTIDFEINTNESSNGGTTLGLDLDSEFTNLNWKMADKVNLAFFPFNFDGEVGVEFNTRDITRINFIEGGPTTILPNQGNNNVIQKTIPGLVFTFGDKRFNVYAGGGLATYLYPTNPTFDIQNNQTAVRWERRTDFGFKFGLNYLTEESRVWLGVVGHTEAAETGALHQSAASLYGIFRLANKFIFEGEFVTAKNGSRPWRLNRSGTWFEQTTAPGFYPIYSDYNGNLQDWLGKTDFAAGAKVGFYLQEDVIPYAALRYQGKYFVFKDEESAHLLRTADESLSHGGIVRGAAGTYLHYGNFVVNPEFEMRSAKNPVFTNAGDAFFANNNQSQRLLARFQKTDYLLSIYLTYSFDGSKPFTP